MRNVLKNYKEKKFLDSKDCKNPYPTVSTRFTRRLITLLPIIVIKTLKCLREDLLLWFHGQMARVSLWRRSFVSAALWMCRYTDWNLSPRTRVKIHVLAFF
ncbi:hypothetical protein L596_001660 [Steinernema carpocapsae]|uniref:Uncharacterized protein n=1 Tax=Steinernema carpocapsae TaxID=34508 RepID=A0A4U8UPI5_STECR|nr:hypothetical protein L596_001660 [Steinernema carpocapsae]